MKWFKHDTDASTDARIKKLILRHGAIGYAIYFHCLELIAGDTNENNITFELEHDSEIIADNLKIQGSANISGIDIVNEIMKYIIELGLFEEKNTHIFCLKLMSRLDTSMTSNSILRKVITDARNYHDSVMTESCKTRLDKTRLDKTRLDKTRLDKIRKEGKDHFFEEFWNLYPRKINKKGALHSYNARIKEGVGPDQLTNSLKIYLEYIQCEKPIEKYIMHPTTFLNGRYLDYTTPAKPVFKEPDCRPDQFTKEYGEFLAGKKNNDRS